MPEDECLQLAKAIGANKSQLMSNLIENAIAADLLGTLCTKTTLTLIVMERILHDLLQSR